MERGTPREHIAVTGTNLAELTSTEDRMAIDAAGRVIGCMALVKVPNAWCAVSSL
jgi:hypothetical protein